jgi:hypothetical protein
METDQSDCSEESEDEQSKCRIRLINARKVANKTHWELGRHICGTSNYYDLENCIGELFRTVSLRELAAIAHELGTEVLLLFTGKSNPEGKLEPDEFVAMIKAFLAKEGLTITEFENRVGCAVEPALSNRFEILNWNLDFLR